MILRTRLAAGFVCVLWIWCSQFGARPAAASVAAKRVEPWGAFEAPAGKEHPMGYRVLLLRDGTEQLARCRNCRSNIQRKSAPLAPGYIMRRRSSTSSPSQSK